MSVAARGTIKTNPVLSLNTRRRRQVNGGPSVRRRGVGRTPGRWDAGMVARWDAGTVGRGAGPGRLGRRDGRARWPLSLSTSIAMAVAFWI